MNIQWLSMFRLRTLALMTSTILLPYSVMAAPVEMRSLTPTALGDANSQVQQQAQKIQELQQELAALKAQTASAASNQERPLNPMPLNGSTGLLPTNTASQYASQNKGVDNSADADKRAYIAAYDAYRAGGASQAIGPMQNFLRDYPNSVYVPNAHYWLGEFYLAVTPPSFVNAKKNFNIVMNTYPKSMKASATVYRLATMAEVEDQHGDATRMMKLLTTDYAGSKEAEYAQTYLDNHKNTSTKAAPNEKSGDHYVTGEHEQSSSKKSLTSHKTSAKKDRKDSDTQSSGKNIHDKQVKTVHDKKEHDKKERDKKEHDSTERMHKAESKTSTHKNDQKEHAHKQDDKKEQTQKTTVKKDNKSDNRSKEHKSASYQSTKSKSEEKSSTKAKHGEVEHKKENHGDKKQHAKSAEKGTITNEPVH